MTFQEQKFNLQSTKLLYSFEDNGDYIYDVQWSPIHPAVFAAVDGMGKLDLWNLNKDTEVRFELVNLLLLLLSLESLFF